MQTRLVLAAASLLAATHVGCVGCGRGSETPDALLRARFPEQAPRILGEQGPSPLVRGGAGFVPRAMSLGPLQAAEASRTHRRGLRLELPLRGEENIRFRLADGFSVQVREADASGEGRVLGASVAYPRRHGTSFWTAAAEGYEEWLLVEAAGVGEGPVATWEVEGGALRQRGDAVEVVDSNGSARIRVTAPEAFAGQPARRVPVRLSVSGTRIALSVDAKGEPVLIDPDWQATNGFLTTKRTNHTATLLNDGRVLVTGGKGGPFESVLKSSEIYDPATGNWSPTGNLKVGRMGHAAVALPSGLVLVTGGSGSGSPFPGDVAETFDPQKGEWTQIATKQLKLRLSHTATLLPSGKVLLVGGDTADGKSAELFDPSAGTWTAAAPMADGRTFHTATLLPSGKVMVAGGTPPSNTPTFKIEIYDPNLGVWSAGGTLATGRQSHTATLLVTAPHAGKVLVAGGRTYAGGYISVSCHELYDPALQPTTAKCTGFSLGWHTATLLPSGKVLVVGGKDFEDRDAIFDPQTYDATKTDPAASGWTVGGTPRALKRRGHTATLLPSGMVLLVGGMNDSSPSLSATELYDPDPVTFTSNTPSPATQRDAHTATLLPSGKVLVAGGATGTSPGATSDAKLYDPDNGGIWNPAGTMTTARKLHSATLLLSGRVLVAGGKDPSGANLTSAELFEPTSNAWTATSSGLAVARNGHTATLLTSGKVVVIGGEARGAPVTQVEVFDPATQKWTTVANLGTPRTRHTATRLPNGKVLVTGGAEVLSPLTYTKACELFDPATGAMSSIGKLKEARGDHTATLLPNGKVLIAAGINNATTPPMLLSSEIYDPATGGFLVASPKLNFGRARHAATLLASGQVLVTGGTDPSQNPSTELFEPATGLWTETNLLQSRRMGHTATLLPGGRVLLVGGVDPLSGGRREEDELADDGRRVGATPGLDPIPASTSGATLALNGSAFSSAPEGSGGGTNSSPTNFPVFQLTALENQETTHLPVLPFTGTTAMVKLGATLPGWYVGRVIVGGVPSNGQIFVVKLAALGTPCTKPEQCESGFCVDGVCCDTVCGAGVCNACSQATGSTVDGTCQIILANCSDGDPCTKQDTCDGSGACKGTAYKCTSKGSCNTSTCDGSGGCIDVNKAEGTACDDLTACSGPDQCTVAGDCRGKSHTCPSSTTPCTQNTCDGQGGCKIVNDADGTSCDDNNLCTKNDVCTSVVCGGASYKCAPTNCQESSSCDGTGSCTIKNKPDATTCDDGNACTFEDTCKSGDCTSRPYSCKTFSICQQSATCDAKGGCSFVTKTDGTTCDDSLACTTGDNCRAGRCRGTPIASDRACSFLSASRAEHTATLLTAGKVLVVGGREVGNSLATAETYDPTVGTWSYAGPLVSERNQHTATLLPSGEVLIVGGLERGRQVKTAETYNPTTGKWTSIPGTLRNLHTATLLEKGKVLVVGGNRYNLPEAELFDPSSSSWSNAGPSVSSTSTHRASHTATLLADGRVLVIGGTDGNGNPTDKTEIYDPVANDWKQSGALTAARVGHTAILLPSGKVLVAGGKNASWPTLRTAELLTVSGSAVAAAPLPDMPNERVGHAATLLPSGRVLISGGSNLTSNVVFDGDSVASPWTELKSAPLETIRDAHTATLLPSGKVLFVGGLRGTYEATLDMAELYDPSVASVTAARWLLPGARSRHSATLVPSGSTVLIGGRDGKDSLSSAVAYDPATGWTPLSGTLATARDEHTATLLLSGKVLVAGGANGGVAIASAEILDPTSGVFSATGAMASPRRLHSATLLPSGRVLVAAGRDSALNFLSTSEIFDPATGKWSAAGSLGKARQNHAAILLPTGRVLVAGGAAGTSVLSTAEIYDPSTNMWTSAGSFSTAREVPAVTLLPSGKILLNGGRGTQGSFAADVDLYDPATKSWTGLKPLPVPRWRHATALLASGKVVVAGGENSAGSLSTVLLYDTVANLWTTTATGLGTARGYATATLLPAGEVLIAGGEKDTAGAFASVDLIDEGRKARSAMVPKLDQPAAGSLGMSLALTGTLFTGVSEGAGGGVQASPANVPVLQLMRADNQAIAMPGLSELSATSANALLAASLYPGWYWARVIVNGVPSAARSLVLRWRKGSLCSTAMECLTGFCADSVCCDKACDQDACDACNTDGTCESRLPTLNVCDDENPCTHSDSCNAGSCAGTTYTCVAKACQQTSTCDGKGGCVLANKVDGTSCDDGIPCSQNDSCKAGSCKGTAYTCTPESCHLSAICDGKGGCTRVNKLDGTICDDEIPCTKDDRCNRGFCVGTNFNCTLKPCQTGGRCDGKGGCTPINDADGTICNDGNLCTRNDACTRGLCAGTAYTCTPKPCQKSASCDGNGGCTPVNEADGTICDDGNPCSQNDRCNSGVCEGAVYKCDPKPCQKIPYCDGKGGCTAANEADGTGCDDQNPCTTDDACQAGACKPGNPVTCASREECRDPGACDPTTGKCSAVVKADGAACTSGTCVSGVCVPPGPDAGTEADAGDSSPGADAGAPPNAFAWGCGCNASGGPSFLPLLALAFPLLFRRRRASLLLVVVLALAGVPVRAAAQKSDQGKTKIAVLTLRNGPGVDAKITELVTELLVGSLQERGLKVVSSKEVETAIGFEKQKRLLGCAEDTSCLAEIGGALGVDRILSGTLGKLGGSLLITLQVINMAKGSVEKRYQTRIKAAKSEEAFIDALGPAVEALFPKPAPAPASSVVAPPASAASTPAALPVEPSPTVSASPPAVGSESEPSFAVAGRFQVMPDVTGGAGVLLVGFRPSPPWTLSAGFLVAGLNKGPMVRASFVPWNAAGTVHPVVAIEAPVLLGASPIIGAGGSAGVEIVPAKWLAIGIEVPVLFLVNAPPWMQRGYVFGATTIGLRL